MIGVILLTLTLLLSFTGYLLPWDQLALWAVTVGTNMMGYTPVFGTEVRFVLLGGVEIGSRDAVAMVRAPRADAAVRHRDLHGHPLLAGPQGRRHLWTALMAARRIGSSLAWLASGASLWLVAGASLATAHPLRAPGREVGELVTEIPEHLRKRAEEARAKAAAAKAEAAPRPRRRRPPTRRRGRAAAPSEAASRIPAHLLERSRAAKARGRRRGRPEAATPAAARRWRRCRRGRAARPGWSRRRRPPPACPAGAGPGGHTQRLLTVVQGRAPSRT